MKVAAFFTRKQRHFWWCFNNCHTYWRVTTQRWRKKIIVSYSNLLQFKTKPQQIILVVIFFMMAISNIKAKLYVLTLRTRSAKKTWFLFVNVIQKLWKVVQMSIKRQLLLGAKKTVNETLRQALELQAMFPAAIRGKTSVRTLCRGRSSSKQKKRLPTADMSGP
jgi:hypothetical protein